MVLKSWFSDSVVSFSFLWYTIHRKWSRNARPVWPKTEKGLKRDQKPEKYLVNAFWFVGSDTKREPGSWSGLSFLYEWAVDRVLQGHPTKAVQQPLFGQLWTCVFSSLFTLPCLQCQVKLFIFRVGMRSNTLQGAGESKIGRITDKIASFFRDLLLPGLLILEKAWQCLQLRISFLSKMF